MSNTDMCSIKQLPRCYSRNDGVEADHDALGLQQTRLARCWGWSGGELPPQDSVSRMLGGCNEDDRIPGLQPTAAGIELCLAVPDDSCMQQSSRLWAPVRRAAGHVRLDLET